MPPEEEIMAAHLVVYSQYIKRQFYLRGMKSIIL